MGDLASNKVNHSGYPATPGDAELRQTLRKRAEAVARVKTIQPPDDLEGLSPERLRSLLHELRVHQLELEMQNEELRRTQGELEVSRFRYFDLYDLAPVGYITLSIDGLILDANLTMAKLLGVARGILTKRPLSRFIAPEDQDLHYRRYKQIFETDAPIEWELRLLRNGASPFWARIEATATLDSSGDPVCRAVVSDITSRRCAEHTLRKTVCELELALREKTVLLQEVHHRVKNNLAVVASLLGMRAEASESAEVKLALGESKQRVYSMALVHEYLYGNDHLDRIDFSEYAGRLVRGLYSTFAGEACRISIELDLDPIEIGIEQAVPCGLILNELLSNAFKYAFEGVKNGRVLISFHETAPGKLELAVEDNGVGLPAGSLGARNTATLGLRIVGILTSQLDGSLEQEICPGTRMVLRFPGRLGS
jgi:PAS domain S-box-containing protein